MIVSHRIDVVVYEPTDPRLGRHVGHDERSRRFALLPKQAKPKGITTHWPSHVKVLDQGNTGSCTGNAAAQWLNTDYAAPTRAKTHAGKAFTEADALHLYSLATHLDSIPGVFPPDDFGSTGLAAAKAGVKLGYLSSYSHLFSFTSTQAALEHTPAMCGTLWTQTMFTPKNGLVTVGALTDANIAGGHEYLCCGVDFTAQVFEFRNSWGDEHDWPGCKPGGYFAIGFHDFAALLDADGDITVPTGTT